MQNIVPFSKLTGTDDSFKNLRQVGLREWQHFLQTPPFTVFIDHIDPIVPTKYFFKFNDVRMVNLT